MLFLSNTSILYEYNLPTGKNQIEDLEKSLDELFEQYQDAIKNVDFRLNTAKVKEDITKRTQKFLKLRK
jgi:hypothetical protein